MAKTPRDLKRDALAHRAEREANAAAQAEANKLTALTVGEVWATYIAGAARTGATCMTATMSTKPNPVACRLGDVVVGRS